MKNLGVISSNVVNETVLPDQGYDAMESVKFTVDVPQDEVQIAKTVNINENGNYTYSADTGYDVIKDINVNVNVPTESDVNVESIKQKTIFTNTTTEITPSNGYDAMEKVVVSTLVDNKTTTKMITQNGTYNAYDETYTDQDQRFDRYIGYSSVTVNVPTGSDVNNANVTANNIITENDTYTIPQGYTGFNGFTVNVPQPRVQQSKVAQILVNDLTEITPDQGYDVMEKVRVITEINNSTTTKTITQNGTYYASNEGTDPETGYTYMGFESVTVNVPIPSIYQYERQLPFNLADDRYPSTSGSITRTVTANLPSGYAGQKAVTHDATLLYKSITQNGTYSIVDDRSSTSEIGYWKVDVNVPTSASNLQANYPIRVTTNNYSTLITPDQGYDGISSINLTVNIPTLTSPVQLWYLKPNSGDNSETVRGFYQNLYTQGDGSFVYLNPGEAAVVWYLRQGNSPSFSIYYYKGTGSQWPIGNAQMNIYRWYLKFTPTSTIDVGTNLSFLNPDNDEEIVLNYNEHYFPNNMPGLLYSYISFPVESIGSKIRLQSWMENIVTPQS